MEEQWQFSYSKRICGNTTLGDNISEMKTDLEEFRQLFDKFVTEPGPSVVWDEIDKLPQNSVRLRLRVNVRKKTNYF